MAAPQAGAHLDDLRHVRGRRRAGPYPGLGRGPADRAHPLPQLFQILIPILGVAVEFFKYDPSERDEPTSNWADRRLERKLAKAERRLRIVAAQVEAKVAQIEKLYRVEEAILKVEQR